jgi:hypothetical protein
MIGFATQDFVVRANTERHARMRCDDDEYYERFKIVEDVTENVRETNVGF